MKMVFTVTLKIDNKELKDFHEDMDADERRDAVRQDVEDAIEGSSLAYMTEVHVVEGKPAEDEDETT